MQIQVNARGFFFVEWFHGAHNLYTTLVWLHASLGAAHQNLTFPVRNAQVFTTAKGGFVLRPAKGTVFLYSVASGYRGTSGVEKVNNGELVTEWKSYHSGQGALGNTTFVLINGGEAPVEVHWTKSGRRVAQTSGIHRLTSDGEIEAVIDDAKVCDLLN